MYLHKRKSKPAGNQRLKFPAGLFVLLSGPHCAT